MGARHVAARRPRRAGLACRGRLLRRDDALAGSYDPVWTAQAEAHFIGGVMRSNSRHPLLAVGRVLILIALLCSILSPLAQLLRAVDVGLLAAFMAGVVVCTVGAATGVLRR